ncbi:MAG: hypothetical protein QXR64_06065 [Pyrobaculum sp.]
MPTRKNTTSKFTTLATSSTVTGPMKMAKNAARDINDQTGSFGYSGLANMLKQPTPQLRLRRLT